MTSFRASKKCEYFASSVIFAACAAVPLAPVWAEDATSAPTDRKIAYVLSSKVLAGYQTEAGKVECPDGLNDGPREEFKVLYPDDGTKRDLAATQLEREGEVWDPRTSQQPLGFKEAQGKIAYGLNLDGKIGPNDFTSPDGEKGIDNQLYRVIGCVGSHRGPEGTQYWGHNKYMRTHDFNRMLIELTNVDSLTNDDDVTVTTYRGLDPLFTDATFDTILPGGTQRIDYRWGRDFITTMRGKIVDGVLTTEPAQVTMPDSIGRGFPVIRVNSWRLRLDLTPEGAEGLMGGYLDIDSFHFSLATLSTHHRSYGQESLPSEYSAMRRLADGVPDPKTGENTAISTAWRVSYKQVFAIHPPQRVADAPIAVQLAHDMQTD